VPWYIKRDRSDLIERYNIPLDECPRRCETQIAEWQSLRNQLLGEKSPLKIRRSVEYGSSIIHSLETGEPRVVYGNVENTGLITNLPAGCCVEVPCMVDKNGIQPTQIGANPCPSCGLDADEHQCSSSDD
jgi:alpha-galactosidase